MSTDAIDTENQEQPQVDEKPLNKMTANELRDLAREVPGITGAHAMKKEELLAAIKKARGVEEEKPVKKTKALKPILSVKELKKKILVLRKEKDAARETGDRHQLDILRRRINRLKKQTKKAAKA